MAKICISGNYGLNCLSDELELAGLLEVLRKQMQDCEIVVFSADPAQTEADFEVKAVENKFEAAKAELNSADLLISAGDHVMKETEDLADLKSYLRILKSAQHYNIPIFAYHQTIPAFTSPRAKAMVAKVMQKVRKITVADADSAEHLKEMGIRPGRIHVVSNPLLLLNSFDPEWNISLIAEKPIPAAVPDEAPETEEPTVINYDGMEVELEIRIVEPKEVAVAAEEETETAIETVEEKPAESEDAQKKQGRSDDLKSIVPSFWKKPGEKFAAFFVAPCVDLPVAQITAIADEVTEKGYCVVFLPLDYQSDIALIREIRGMMKHPSFIVDARMSPFSILTAVQETEFVFSTGKEGLLAAVICGKAFATLCVNDEMTALVKALGVEPTGVLAEYNGETFLEAFKAVLEQPEAIINAVKENLPALQESADEGIRQLTAIFEIIDRRKARESRAEDSKPQAVAVERRKEQVKNILGFDKIKDKIPKLKADLRKAETDSDEEAVTETAEITDAAEMIVEGNPVSEPAKTETENSSSAE